MRWKTFTYLCNKFIAQDNCTKFYQNQSGFAEDMTKTFWCVFFQFTVKLLKLNKYKRTCSLKFVKKNHFVSHVLCLYTEKYVVSNVDESYSESDLVCMTNHGKLCVFSLPHLRRQLCTDTVISPDIARLLRSAIVK